MTRWIRRVVLVTLLSCVVGTPAWSRVEDAVKLETEGQWSEAAQLWQRLAEAKPQSEFLWHRLLESLKVSGNYERLEEQASKVMSKFPSGREGFLYRAWALEEMGRVEDAAELLRPNMNRDVVIKAELARLLTRLGRNHEASPLYSEVMAAYDPNVQQHPWDLLAFGDAAKARSDFKGAARVYELSYTDSLEFIPGRLALSKLFHEKYQSGLSNEELKDARKLAPNHPDVVLALAELSVRSRRYTQAEEVAKQVLKFRPEDTGSRRILAQLDLIAGDTEAANRKIKGLLALNPHDLQTLEIKMASGFFSGDSTKYRNAIKEIEAIDPLHVDGFVRLGAMLEALIRNPDAEWMYRQALMRDPELAEGYAGLGHLAMREGREVEARGLLDKAHELDSYNIRAYNQLELLDEMDNYRVYDFEDFQFKLSEKDDGVLVPIMADRMRDIYNELVALHGWKPKVPTMIEIFPTHPLFSARVVGITTLDGIPGVCFGDVVAMDSPRTLSGKSNWEQIMRHEFGHVLALGMTNRKVPFWFTEGLSVHLETHPRPQAWDSILMGAYWDGELVSVDSLTIAFTRPKHRFQRLLAYHEAGIVIDAIVDRHGWDVIPELLHAFADGKQLDEAVKDVLGESKETFDRLAMDAVRGRAESLNLWPRPDPNRQAAFQVLAEENPKDLEILGRLAVTDMQLGRMDDATRTAKKILKEDENNARAKGVLGLIAVQENHLDRAKTLMDEAIANDSRDLQVYLSRSSIALTDRDTTMAKTLLQKALEVYPNSADAYRGLALIAEKSGDSAGAGAYYDAWMSIDDTSQEAALPYARIALERGEAEKAHEALRFVRNVSPLAADVIALEGQALLALDEDREAFNRFSEARKQDLRSVEAMVGMAQYYFKQEDFEEAIYFARLALKYEPTHKVAKSLLSSAEEEI